MRPSLLTLLALALVSTPAAAFVRSRLGSGFLRRTDASNVRFLVNERTAAGLTSSAGRVVITAGSDPLAALQAAADSWTNIPSSSLTLAAMGRTPVENSVGDNENTISFADTPENQSVVGDAVAVTRIRAVGGNIIDTDILYSARLTFSTTLQPDALDIQTVAAHEIGHALGANHSPVLAATMYFAIGAGTNLLSLLSTDDVAFATEVYPEAGSAGSSFGAISGAVNLNGGGPVPVALVTAIDPSAGVAVGTITGADGSYTLSKLPPGRYFVYAEPADGPVDPQQFSGEGAGANTSFTTGLHGGAASPQAVAVGSGATATVNLTVEGASPALNIQGGGMALPTGGIFFARRAFALGRGQTTQINLFGPGLDDPAITESSISFLGVPITVQPGTLQRGRTPGTGLPTLIFTVQVSPAAPLGVVTAVLRTAASLAVFSGGIRILPPMPSFTAAGVVSGASFLGGAAAPGEIVSIFGTNLGPANGVVGTLDSAGRLAASLAGVTVTFNGVPAPLFFASQGQINAQAPFETAGQSTASVIARYQGTASAPVSVGIRNARPGIFVVPGSSRGIIANQDGALNSASNPIDRGRVVIIYATGQGVVDPPLDTGQLAPASPLSSAPAVTVTFGGRPGRVLFGGMTPGFAGLMQVNVEVPSDAPTGNAVPVVVTVAGVSSQPNVTLAVR